MGTRSGRAGVLIPALAGPLLHGPQARPKSGTPARLPQRPAPAARPSVRPPLAQLLRTVPAIFKI
jgi:hypothetical protein